MAVQLAKVGSVPPRRLAGWVADASYHVVINETGAVVGPLGEIRYPSEYPGSVQFPAEVAAGEAWVGWIDGLNVGDAAGDFQFWISSTSACTGDMVKTPTEALNPGAYVALELTGSDPADFWICWMRYVP